jgi:hypothetical protein
VTRKTQILLGAAALVGLAAAAAFWLTRDNGPAPDDAHAQTPPTAPKDGPPDPRTLSEVRHAVQENLTEGAPPGMVELMHGPEKDQPKPKPGELPPLGDPFVVPAGHQSSGPPADLPPLPPLPSVDPAPPAKKPAAKEEAPADLPPLPPLPSVPERKPADPPR